MLQQWPLRVEDALWASAQERVLSVSLQAFSCAPPSLAGRSPVSPPSSSACPTAEVRRKRLRSLCVRETRAAECSDGGRTEWPRAPLGRGFCRDSENIDTACLSWGCAQGLVLWAGGRRQRGLEFAGVYGCKERGRRMFLVAGRAASVAPRGQGGLARHSADSDTWFLLLVPLPECSPALSFFRQEEGPQEEGGSLVSRSGRLRACIGPYKSLLSFRALQNSSWRGTAGGRKGQISARRPQLRVKALVSSLISFLCLLTPRFFRVIACIAIRFSRGKFHLCAFFPRVPALWAAAALLLAADACRARVLCSPFLRSSPEEAGTPQLPLTSGSCGVAPEFSEFLEEQFVSGPLFSLDLPGDFSIHRTRRDSADEGFVEGEVLPTSIQFFLPCASLPFQEGSGEHSSDRACVSSRDKDRRMRRAAASAPPAAPAGDTVEGDDEERSRVQPPAVSAGFKAEGRRLEPSGQEHFAAASLGRYELILTSSLARRRYFRDRSERGSGTFEAHRNGVRNGITGPGSGVSRVARPKIPAFQRGKSFSRLSPGVFAGWSALAARFVSAISLIFLFGLLVWSRDGSRVHQDAAAGSACMVYSARGIEPRTDILFRQQAQEAVNQGGSGGVGSPQPLLRAVSSEAEREIQGSLAEDGPRLCVGDGDIQAILRCVACYELYSDSLDEASVSGSCSTSTARDKVPPRIRLRQCTEDETASFARHTGDGYSPCVGPSIKTDPERRSLPVAFLSCTPGRFVSAVVSCFSCRTRSFEKECFFRRLELVPGSPTFVVQFPTSTSSGPSSSAAAPFVGQPVSPGLEESMSRSDGARRPPSRPCTRRHGCSRGVASSGNAGYHHAGHSACGAFTRKSPSALPPHAFLSFGYSLCQEQINPAPLSTLGPGPGSGVVAGEGTAGGNQGDTTCPVKCSPSWCTGLSRESVSTQAPTLPGREDSVPEPLLEEQVHQPKLWPFPTLWLAERQQKSSGLTRRPATRTQFNGESAPVSQGNIVSHPADPPSYGSSDGCLPACMPSGQAAACGGGNLVSIGLVPRDAVGDLKSGHGACLKVFTGIEAPVTCPRSVPTEPDSRSTAAVQCCVRIFAAVEHATPEKMLYGSKQGNERDARGVALQGDSGWVGGKYTGAGSEAVNRFCPHTETRNGGGGVGQSSQVSPPAGGNHQAPRNHSSVRPPSSPLRSHSGSFSSVRRTSTLSPCDSSVSTVGLAALCRSRADVSGSVVVGADFCSDFRGAPGSCSEASAVASHAPVSSVVAAPPHSAWNSPRVGRHASGFAVAAAAAGLAAQSLPGVVQALAAPVADGRPSVAHVERERVAAEGSSCAWRGEVHSDGDGSSSGTYPFAGRKKGGPREAPWEVEADRPTISSSPQRKAGAPGEVRSAGPVSTYVSGHHQRGVSAGEGREKEGALDWLPSYTHEGTTSASRLARDNEHVTECTGRLPSSPLSATSSALVSPALALGPGAAGFQNGQLLGFESSGKGERSTASVASSSVGPRLGGHSFVASDSSLSSQRDWPEKPLWSAADDVQVRASGVDSGSSPGVTELKKPQSRSSRGLDSSSSDIGDVGLGGELRRGELERRPAGPGRSGRENGELTGKPSSPAESADATSLAVSGETSLARFSQAARWNSTEEGRHRDRQEEGSGESRLSSPAPSSFRGDGDSDEGGQSFRPSRGQESVQSLIVLSVTGELYHVTTDGSFVWQQSLGSSLATAFDVEPSSSPETTEKERDPSEEGEESSGTGDAREKGDSEGRRTQLAPAGLGRRLLPAHDGSLFFLDDDGSLTALHVSIPEVVNHLPFQAPLFPHVYFTGEREVSVTALDLNTGRPLTGGSGSLQRKKKKQERGRVKRGRGGRPRKVEGEDRAEEQEGRLMPETQTKVEKHGTLDARDFVVEPLSLTRAGDDGEMDSNVESAAGVKARRINRGRYGDDSSDRPVSWSRKEGGGDVDRSEEEAGHDDEKDDEPRQLQFGVTVWTLWAVDSKNHTTQWGLKWVEVDALGSLSPPPSPGMSSPAVSYLRNILRVDEDKLYLLPNSSSSSENASTHPSPSAAVSSEPPALRSSSTTYTGSASFSSLPGTSPRRHSFTGHEGSTVHSLGGHASDSMSSPSAEQDTSPPRAAPVFLKFPAPIAAVYVVGPPPGSLEQRVAVRSHPLQNVPDLIPRGELGEGRGSAGLDQQLALPSPFPRGRRISSSGTHSAKRHDKPGSRKKSSSLSTPSSVTLECIIRQWDGGCAALPFSYVPAPHHAVQGRQFELGFPAAGASSQLHLPLTLPPVQESDEGERRGGEEETSSLLPLSALPSGVGSQSAGSLSPRMAALATVRYRGGRRAPVSFRRSSVLTPIRGYLEDAPREAGDDAGKENRGGPVRSPSSALSLLPSSFSPSAELADYPPPGPEGAAFDPLGRERGRQIRRHAATSSRFSTMARFGAHNFKAPVPVQPIRVSSDYVSLSFLPTLGEWSGRESRGSSRVQRRKDRRRNVSFSSREKIEEVDDTAYTSNEASGRRRRQVVPAVSGWVASTRKAREEKAGQERHGSRTASDSSNGEESEDGKKAVWATRDRPGGGDQASASAQGKVEEVLSQMSSEAAGPVSAGVFSGEGQQQREEDRGKEDGGRSERGGYETFERLLYLVPPSPSPFYAATQPPLSFNPVLSPVLSVLKRWLGRLTRSSSRPVFSVPLSSTVPEGPTPGKSALSNPSVVPGGTDDNGICYDSKSLFSLSIDNTTSRLVSPLFPPVQYPSNNATATQSFHAGQLLSPPPFSWGSHRHSRTPSSVEAPRTKASENHSEEDKCAEDASSASSAFGVGWCTDGDQDDSQENAREHDRGHSLAAWWRGTWGLTHVCMLIGVASAVLLLARLRGSSPAGAAVAFALVPFTGGRAKWWWFWRFFTLLLPPVLRREPAHQEEEEEGTDIILEPPWFWRKPRAPWENCRDSLLHSASGSPREEGATPGAAARSQQTAGGRRARLPYRVEGWMPDHAFSSALLDYRRSEVGRTSPRSPLISSFSERVSADFHLSGTASENAAWGSMESYSTSAASWKTPLHESIKSVSIEELQRLQEVASAWYRLVEEGEQHNESVAGEEGFVSLDAVSEDETGPARGYSRRGDDATGVELEREVSRLRTPGDHRCSRGSLSPMSVCKEGVQWFEGAAEMAQLRTEDADQEDGRSMPSGVRTPMYSCRTTSSASLSSQEGKELQKAETSRMRSADVFPHFVCRSEPSSRPPFHRSKGDGLSDEQLDTGGHINAGGTTMKSERFPQVNAAQPHKEGRRRAGALLSGGRKLSDTSITAFDSCPVDFELQSDAVSASADRPESWGADGGLPVSSPPGILCLSASTSNHPLAVSADPRSGFLEHSTHRRGGAAWEPPAESRDHDPPPPGACLSRDRVPFSPTTSSAPAESPAVDASETSFVAASGKTGLNSDKPERISSGVHTANSESAAPPPDVKRKGYPRKTSDVTTEAGNTVSEYKGEVGMQTARTTTEKTSGPSAPDSARRSGDVPGIQLPGGRLGGGSTGEGFSAEEWQRVMFRRAGRRCNSVGQLSVYGAGRGASEAGLGTRASHDHISVKPSDSVSVPAGPGGLPDGLQHQSGASLSGDTGGVPDGSQRGDFSSGSPNIHAFSPPGSSFPSSSDSPCVTSAATQLLGGMNISPRTPIPSSAERIAPTDFRCLSRVAAKPLVSKVATLLPFSGAALDQEGKVAHTDRKLHRALVSSTVPHSPSGQPVNRIVSPPLALALSDAAAACAVARDASSTELTLPPPAASVPPLGTSASVSTAIPASSSVMPGTPSGGSAFPSAASAEGGGSEDNTYESSGAALGVAFRPASGGDEGQKEADKQKSVAAEAEEALRGTEQRVVVVVPAAASSGRALGGKAGACVAANGKLEKATDLLVGAPVKVDVPPVERGIPSDSSLAKLLENGRFERTFCIQKLVGQGGFGVVYEVRHLLEPGHPIYAVKLILLHLSLSEDISLRRDFREVAANRDLYSKHVVRYYTWWCEEPRFLPVTSLGGGQGLADRKALGDGSSSAVSGRGGDYGGRYEAMESRKLMTGKDRNSRLWGQSMQSDMDDETRRGRSPGTRALGCSREERQGRRRLAESQGMSSLWYWRGSGGGAYSAGGDSRLGEALCDRSISMTGTDRRGRSREPRHLDRGEEDGFPGRECGRRAQAGFAAQTTRRRRETADAADLQMSSRGSRHRGSVNREPPGSSQVHFRRRHSVPHDCQPSSAPVSERHVIVASETSSGHLPGGSAVSVESPRKGRLASAFLRAASEAGAPRRNRGGERKQAVRRSKSFSSCTSPLPSPEHRPVLCSNHLTTSRGRTQVEEESSEDNRCWHALLERQRSDLSSLFSGEREVALCPECGEEVLTGVRTPQRRAFSTPPWKNRQMPLGDSSSSFLFGTSEEETGAGEGLIVQGGLGGGHAGKRFLLCGGDSFSDTECTYSSQGKTQGGCSCEIKREGGENRSRRFGGQDDDESGVEPHERDRSANEEDHTQATRRQARTKEKEKQQSPWSHLEISFDMNCYLNTQERDMIVFEEENSTNAGGVARAEKEEAGQQSGLHDESRCGEAAGMERNSRKSSAARDAFRGRDKTMKSAEWVEDEEKKKGGGVLAEHLRRHGTRWDERGGRDKTRAKESLYPVVLLIQMEMCTGVTLREWLDRKDRSTIAMDFVPSSKNRWHSMELELFKQLMKGIRDIHERGIVHRDLKPENIFVDPSTHVLKIVDFGLAKFIQRENNSGSAGVPTSAMDGGNKPPDQLRVVEGDAVNDRERQRQKMKGLLAKARRMGRNMEVSYKGEVIGTPAYAAPEGGGLCDEKADIYSGALILLELLCPRFTTVMERVKTLEDFKLNYLVPEHIRLHLLPWYLLMKEMARPDPQHRPSAHAVLKQVKMLLTTPAAEPHRVLLVYSDQSNQPSLPPSTSLEPVVPPSEHTEGGGGAGDLGS